MLFKILALMLALVVTVSAANATAAGTQGDDLPPLAPPIVQGHGKEIEGLIHVHKDPKKHWYQIRRRKVYEYKVKNTDLHLFLTEKLKGEKDLRDYAEKHPHRQWLHDRAVFWGPVFSLFLSGYAGWATIRTATGHN